MTIRIDGTNTAANPGITGADADTGLQFGTDEIKVVTGGTEAITVDASQRVGIGTASPAYKLHCNTATETTVLLQGTTYSQIFFGDASSGPDSYAGYLQYDHSNDSLVIGTAATERMRITSSGRLNIFSNSVVFARSSVEAGTTYTLYQGFYSATDTTDGTLSFRVYTNGNVQNTNNSYLGISDIKLKENIVDASSQWDDIKALRPVNYNFKEGQTHTQLGLIAQEVEQVCPGLVSESPDRDKEGNDLGTVTKSVNYSVLYMKAVKALQEAIARIETLEAEVQALKGGTN